MFNNKNNTVLLIITYILTMKLHKTQKSQKLQDFVSTNSDALESFLHDYSNKGHYDLGKFISVRWHKQQYIKGSIPNQAIKSRFNFHCWYGKLVGTMKN